MFLVGDFNMDLFKCQQHAATNNFVNLIMFHLYKCCSLRQGIGNSSI